MDGPFGFDQKASKFLQFFLCVPVPLMVKKQRYRKGLFDLATSLHVCCLWLQTVKPNSLWLQISPHFASVVALLVPHFFSTYASRGRPTHRRRSMVTARGVAFRFAYLRRLESFQCGHPRAVLTQSQCNACRMHCASREKRFLSDTARRLLMAAKTIKTFGQYGPNRPLNGPCLDQRKRAYEWAKND